MGPAAGDQGEGATASYSRAEACRDALHEAFSKHFKWDPARQGGRDLDLAVRIVLAPEGNVRRVELVKLSGLEPLDRQVVDAMVRAGQDPVSRVKMGGPCPPDRGLVLRLRAAARPPAGSAPASP